MPRRHCAWALLLVTACASGPSDRGGGDAATELAGRAQTFLGCLQAEQRDQAALDFAADERANWQFVPGVYPGVPLADLDVAQKRAAHDLLHAGLSAAGYHKTTTVFGLEDLLRDLAEAAGRTQEVATRDPGRYAFAVFGAPGDEHGWGFRVQGHHVSWNFTIVGDQVSATPAFLGANPAEVRTGHLAGLRALPDEEDLARRLLGSLSAAQREAALDPSDAPADVIWGPGSLENTLGDPRGIAHRDMEPEQRDLLWRLVEVYLGNLDEAVAAQHRARIEATGRDGIHFFWIGSAARGEGHYYRIHGPGFAIEYDNTQNGANHVHTVVHDLTGDFGRNLLREHHELHRAHGHDH